jgi:hypothetical protein
MYPCRGLEPALILYYYGIVGGRKAWLLEEHVSRCHRCKDYLKKLDKVSRMESEDRGHSGFLGEESLFSHPGMTAHR